MISSNIAIIKEKIRKTAEKIKRNPDDIRLVCITKGRSVEEVKEVIDCGVMDIGENRVQEAAAKQKEMDAHFPPSGTSRGHDSAVGNLSQLRWHMVGHLQTNKVRDAVRMFDLIHSVDSLRLAKEIDKEAKKINKVQDALIEVNTSGETTKLGIKPEGLIDLVKEVINLKNINLLGLMTIAPVVKDKEETSPYFRKLRELKDEVNSFLLSYFPTFLLSTLSMGMSQDYEVAIEEGATMVRIGTAIFRNTDDHRCHSRVSGNPKTSRNGCPLSRA